MHFITAFTFRHITAEAPFKIRSLKLITVVDSLTDRFLPSLQLIWHTELNPSSFTNRLFKKPTLQICYYNSYISVLLEKPTNTAVQWGRNYYSPPCFYFYSIWIIKCYMLFCSFHFHLFASFHVSICMNPIHTAINQWTKSTFTSNNDKVSVVTTLWNCHPLLQTQLEPWDEWIIH